MTLRAQVGTPGRARRVILDTGPMLVLAVGSYNAALLGSLRRTETYAPDDYERLLTYLGEFVEPPVTTPNVLTEISNLLRIVNRRPEFFGPTFQAAWRAVGEEFVACQVAMADALFLQFGITDCSLRNLATDEAVLLTDDLELYTRTTPNAVNFAHLRFSTP